MSGPRVNITERTSVPLFAAAGAVFVSASMLGGCFMWVAAISTQAQVAHATNLEQDARLGRISAFTQTQLSEQSRLLKEVSDRTARTEAMVEVIYKHNK